MRRIVEWFSNVAAASVRGSRSTALKDLCWLVAIVLAALLAASGAGAPDYVVKLLAGAAGLVILLTCGTYVYLLVKNPDALRSESYTLEKMRIEIEKGMIGDTTSGFAQVRPGSDTRPALPAAVDQQGTQKP
jgi:hypothetical protein